MIDMWYTCLVFFLFLLSELANFKAVAIEEGKQAGEKYSPKKYNLRVRMPKKATKSATPKEPIPDLNFPPPDEENQMEVSDRQAKKVLPESRAKSEYARLIARHIKNGTLAQFREAERVRRKEFNRRFTKEELRAKSLEHDIIRRARDAKVSIMSFFIWTNGINIDFIICPSKV